MRGSLEYFASSVALVRSYNAMSGKMEPQGDRAGNSIRAKEVFELSYKGDPNARRAIEENALYVGSGLANLISIFSPEIIVLGGGMALARDEYIDLIRENANKNSIEFCRKDVKIERATLGYHGALKGAAFFALTRLDGKYI
ncbi:MAG: ROK family protein [Bacteroidales bacterium]